LPATVGSVQRRVLIIGLDGATFRLLEPWAREGDLPHLAGFMARGAYGELRSTFPALTPPAWSSFMTGKNPGKHGVYSFRETAAARYESGPLVSANLLQARTLWEIVGEAGLPVGAINVPPSYPVRPVNGFMVACMFAPPGDPRVIHPKADRPLVGDDYVINVKPPGDLRLSDPAYGERALQYLRLLRANAERRLALTTALMRRHEWALLSVVFYEPDRIQHFFWDYLVGRPPEGVPAALARAITEQARDIYRLLDQATGALVAEAGADTTVFVVSDHGFGPGPERVVHVNHWLADRGLLTRHRSWRARRWLVKQLPRRYKQRWKTVENLLVNFPASAAWCEVMETRSAGIWLNLRGRQPRGWIEPGADYERRRSELIAALSGLQEDGQPLFARVVPREAMYDGPAVTLAPDVLLEAAPRYGFTFGLRTELGSGRLTAPFDGSGYRGAHEPAGILLALGPDIAANGRVGSAPIEAIAPTTLCLLGLGVPAGMDAAPMLDLLTPEARAAIKIEMVEDAAPVRAALDVAEDQSQVEEQLRALGYLE
jgi:predicted AlkP superfamily phosphohydrolase/phosphomutase